jgi:hypothetical protein
LRLGLPDDKMVTKRTTGRRLCEATSPDSGWWRPEATGFIEPVKPKQDKHRV